MMIKKRLVSALMVIGLVLGCAGVQVLGAIGDWEELTPAPNIKNYSTVTPDLDNKVIYVSAYDSTSRRYVYYAYEIDTDTWVQKTVGPGGNGSSGGYVYNNKIYTPSINVLDGLEIAIYDIQNDTWSYVKTNIPYDEIKSVYATFGIANKLYIITNASCIKIYDISTRKIIDASEGIYPFANGMGMTLIGDEIYITGGPSLSGNMQVYKAQSDTWRAIEDMPHRRSNHIAESDDRYIYVIGGFISDTPYEKALIDVFDTIEESWHSAKPIPQYRYNMKSTIVNDEIYLFGGTVYNADLSTQDTTDLLRIHTSQLGPYTPPEPQNKRLSVLLEQEETARLIVTDRPTDNTNYLWTSSDEEVATVDDTGRVTAIAPGLALITAESPDGVYSDSIPVRVVPKGAAGERLAVYLEPGEEQWLYLNDNYDNIEWESMDPEVVEVDDRGKLTALKKGLAIVKATYEDETYLIYVRVG